MPSQPISAARKASRGSMMPLTTRLRGKSRRYCSRSRQVWALNGMHANGKIVDGLGISAGHGIGPPVLQHRRPAAMPQILDDPAGMCQRLEQDRGFQAECLEKPAADIGKPVADIALALWSCTGTSTVSTSASRPASAVRRIMSSRDLGVARRVELIPRIVWRDFCRRLDRVVAGARHDVGDVRSRRRLGQHQIGAAAEEARAAGRRDAERARIGAAEQGRRLVALRDIDQVARQQLMLVERRGVALEPALVLEPALDEIEGDLRQPPLRHAVQIFDIDGVIDPHLGVNSRAPQLSYNGATIAYFCATRQSPTERGWAVHGSWLGCRIVTRSASEIVPTIGHLDMCRLSFRRAESSLAYYAARHSGGLQDWPPPAKRDGRLEATARARRAREAKEIRSKLLKLNDSGFVKQVITGPRWRMGDDLRH